METERYPLLGSQPKWWQRWFCCQAKVETAECTPAPPPSPEPERRTPPTMRLPEPPRHWCSPPERRRPPMTDQELQELQALWDAAMAAVQKRVQRRVAQHERALGARHEEPW
ncbi:uncharacterized protein [Maniola hyperantus]|uniref:uncharacterized protein n=1 Tax=Aphantopus hyperantus TaxID=2795564 RepID=UPI0021218DC6